MPPPFWAFAWPGSEALARFVTLNLEIVAGRHVLDFAAGSGLAALACARAGGIVDANDIDLFAGAVITLNASVNHLKINVIEENLVGQGNCWDVILCGDVCYEAAMTREILPWLRHCAREALVIVADPGRKYVPMEGREELGRVEVPVSLDLEDRPTREVTLFKLLPG